MKFIKNIKALKPIIRKLKIGNFEFRLNMHALKRMQYAYICFQAAKLGKKLGYERISVVEYGVAGGQGLLILEEHINEIENYLNIRKEAMDVLNSINPPDLKFHEVTKEVNKPINNDPSLINKLN